MSNCGVWGADRKGYGFFCTEPRDHKGDHIARGGGSDIIFRWPNNLDKMTRVESAKAMAHSVGANARDIVRAEDAGRTEARFGGGLQRQSSEALDMVCLEAFQDAKVKLAKVGS